MASSFDAVNVLEVAETNNMIEHNNLDVRTITMGISLLDCAAGDVDTFCDNIYKKITRYAIIINTFQIVAAMRVTL